MKTQNQQPKIITLYGNVGNDPEIKIIPGKDRTKMVYDAVLDQLAERHIAGKDQELRTFSIAINAKTPETGEELTRWIRCADWKGNSKNLRKGDRFALQGTLREHTYEKDGEQKTVKDFTVLDVRVQQPRHRGTC